MGFAVYFKEATLMQKFTLASRRYANECWYEAASAIHAEAPRDLVGRIDGRPCVWDMTGVLTPGLEQKLKALPFVDKVVTDEQETANPQGLGKKPKTIKDKIKAHIRRFVYK